MSANFLHRIRAVLLAILLTAAFAVPALAGPFEDAVAKFANDDFSDTDEAIGTVATSGNPLAFPIISALKDERLSPIRNPRQFFVTGAANLEPPRATVDNLSDGAAASAHQPPAPPVEAPSCGMLASDPAAHRAAQSVFQEP